MTEGLRSGLLLFALLTLLSAVPVVLRRPRPLSLLLVHAQGLFFVFTMVACAVAGEGDARPLLLPYLVGLTLVALGGPGPGGSRPVPRALARSGFALGLLGAGATAATLFSLALPLAARLSLGALSAGFGAMATWRCSLRARAAESGIERRSHHAAALASALGAGAVSMALVPENAFGPAPWAAPLALAAALTTSARMPPFVPPSGREGVSALFVGLALLFASTAEGASGALESGLEGALVTLAVLATSRPLLGSGALWPRRQRPPSRQSTRAPPSLVAEAALAHMSPMLDDARLLRPSRPRVSVRVTARRLFDAALERARAAGPPGRRSLAVEVREDDADLDVEGDAGELAEALCAVLDNALRLKQEHPALSVCVYVRGSPSHVTFEVEDDLARQDGSEETSGPAFRPFAEPREGAASSGGLGVGLARARLLVERHGGELLARRTAGGSSVQLTVPRRRVRHPFGIA